MKARCQNVHPSLLTAEQTQIRAVQMFSRPPKQVFVQPAVGQDTRGTHPAAPQQAAQGRSAPPRCKRTLVPNKNTVLSATTPARKTNRCVESVKSADVVSGAAAAGGAV